MNLLGCTVIHKEKQVRKKEHKLKIIPTNADVIVLGLQSKDQAEQWLRVSDTFRTCPTGAPMFCWETRYLIAALSLCALAPFLTASLYTNIPLHFHVMG